MLARRTQGFERGPRGPTDKTRSELRVLAYPELGCRQRLTTWKKNGRCGPGEGARSEAVGTHYRFTLASARLNRALGTANEAFCGRPPRADPTKCGVSPHLPQMIAGAGCPGSSVAAPAGAGYWEKEGLGRGARSSFPVVCGRVQGVCSSPRRVTLALDGSPRLHVLRRSSIHTHYARSVGSLRGVHPSANTICAVSKSGRRRSPARSAVRWEAMLAGRVRAITGRWGR